jgi:hypothetical protein
MSKNTPNLYTSMQHQSDSKYLNHQKHLYKEASQLASQGAEFSDIVALLNPEYSLRLKIFVQQLPDELANLTIYGRSVKQQIAKPKRK